MNSVRGDGSPSPASAPDVGAGGSGGKRRANSKLGQMRFMQRAAQKVAATAAPEQPAAEQDPMRWEAAADGGGGSGGGCVVITEDAPLPGAGLGHMSFGGFSPALEAMQAELETVRAAAAAQRAAPADSATGAVISDEAMAAALARAQQRVGDGNSGAGAASCFQRPAAMAPVHFGVGGSWGVPAGSAAPAAGNGNAAEAAVRAPAAAATGVAARSAGSRGEASREQDQLDDGILRFGDDPAQQGGQKRRKKKRKQPQQQQPQQEGAVAPLRGPKRKKHERGQLAL